MPSAVQIQAWAYGLLHLSTSDFLAMKERVFWAALEEHWKEKRADRVHIGELVRGAALRLFNIQLPRAKQIGRPSDFWQMPWDEDKAKAEQEEIERLEALTSEERDNEVRAFLARLEK